MQAFAKLRKNVPVAACPPRSPSPVAVRYRCTCQGQPLVWRVINMFACTRCGCSGSGQIPFVAGAPLAAEGDGVYAGTVKTGVQIALHSYD